MLTSGRRVGSVRVKNLAGQVTESGPVLWRRQRNKGARPFRGQNILQPGHQDALFFPEKVQNTKAANAAEIVSLSK